MDNLRDLVANVEFLERKHVDLRMKVPRSITSHNYDIIMAFILYHRCGMHFAYQHKTDNKAHRNPLGYTTSNHYSPHNHLTSIIYHPQVVRT
ncbi:unnamed protein product [Spirodela intermedia]|uniref:Uncharacterized protein n=1 Tax=Spirodela intermedia TaxID=51605 RepID=A0A7I8J0T1_SPIIN|nr:unnamed protein product [Spirodela intermedia]CAA6662920.1 unnamed protein product [Spirodela intermedia]